MADTYTRVKDITVNITIAPVAGSVGLGNPLIIQGMAEQAVDYTECSGIEDVVALGFSMDTEIYKAASNIFMQKTKPKTIAICATTGAAPVPVPPPIPAVINTRSQSFNASEMLAFVSSAAF